MIDAEPLSLPIDLVHQGEREPGILRDVRVFTEPEQLGPRLLALVQIDNPRNSADGRRAWYPLNMLAERRE